MGQEQSADSSKDKNETSGAVPFWQSSSGRKKGRIMTFEEHVSNIKTMKRLCEPSNVTQKPENLAILVAR